MGGELGGGGEGGEGIVTKALVKPGLSQGQDLCIHIPCAKPTGRPRSVEKAGGLPVMQ